MTYIMDVYGEGIVSTGSNELAIAMDLQERGGVVTTWLDGEGSKFDLVWNYNPKRVGHSSMIDQGTDKLFVAIVRKGCWAWPVSSGDVHPSYVAEKLGVAMGSAKPLAELIGAVRKMLAYVKPPPVVLDRGDLSYLEHLRECSQSHGPGGTCPENLTDEPGKVTRLT